jgi:hypothetical protein
VLQALLIWSCLTLPFQLHLVKITSYEALHYVIFSKTLLFYPSRVHIFSSVPCYRTPIMCLYDLECDYRRGLDCWMDLLITYTHDSELQAITAPPLISIIHKSPACCVFTSRYLATVTNSVDSSASRTQVISSQTLVQNW